jgi:dipeptidyl aminopeptidase/acylaminoacyl peptidase
MYEIPVTLFAKANRVLLLPLALMSQMVLAEEPAKASAKPITIEEFAKHREIDVMKLSPDGKTLAILAPQSDYESTLIFIDVATMKPLVRLADSRERILGNIHWANNERVIGTVVQKFGGFASPLPNGELVGVNLDGTKKQFLYGSVGTMQAGSNIASRAQDSGFARLYDGMIDDPKFALITVSNYSSEGAFTELHQMNEYSGRHRKIERAPVRNGDFTVDNAGKAQLVFSQDVQGAYHLFQKQDDEWKKVLVDSAEDAYFAPISFSRDDKSFYALKAPEKGPALLVRVDVKTMKSTTLYQPKFASPGGFLVTADGKDIYAVFNNEGLGSIEIIDESANEAKVWKMFSKSFPGQLVYPVSYSRDGATALFMVSSSTNSGEYYLFDTVNRKGKFLFARDSWLDPSMIGETKAISFKARDGLNLHGFLTLPRGKEAKNLPLVIMPHGGPHGVRDDASYDGWMQVIVNAGYAVLKVDYRGSGGYGRAFEIAGYGQWGRKMQDDLTDATLWAVAQGYADKDRLAIMGASYGGYAALMGAAREPDLYKAVISYVGVSDLELMYTRGDIEDSLYGENYLKRVIGEDKAVLKQNSPVNLASKFNAPVLIIHGGRDQRVPVVHGKRMRDALQDAGKTVEYFEVADEMHGFYKEKNVAESYRRMIAFLDKALKNKN